jgi:hypothetical protein
MRQVVVTENPRSFDAFVAVRVGGSAGARVGRDERGEHDGPRPKLGPDRGGRGRGGGQPGDPVQTPTEQRPAGRAPPTDHPDHRCICGGSVDRNGGQPGDQGSVPGRLGKQWCRGRCRRQQQERPRDQNSPYPTAGQPTRRATCQGPHER